MELVSHCLQQVEADEPYVVCNEKKQIVSASKPIRDRFSDWYGMDVELLMADTFVTRDKRLIQSEQDGELLGMSFSLEEAKKRNITVSFPQFPGNLEQVQYFSRHLAN